MLDAIHVSTLVAAIAIILVFVPLGGSAAFFVVYKMARNCSRWTRQYLEIHTAFLTILVCTVVVPMQLATNIMPFLNVPTPRGLELAETLTMRICQVVMIVIVAAIAMKRARTSTRGVNSHCKRAEIGSILLAWATGLSVGIGTTYQAARDAIDTKQNFTLDLGSRTAHFSSGCFANTNAVYFSAVYLGLLFTTTLVIFGVCVLITRHIQSYIGVSPLVSLYRIPDAAPRQKFSETTTGKKTTMITGPIKDQGCSGVIVNNWVSDQPNLGTSIHRIGVFDPRLPSCAAVVEESGEVNEFHPHVTPSPEPSTSGPNCRMKNPLSIRNKALDTTELGKSKIDVVSILSGEQIRKTHNTEVLRSSRVQMINSGKLGNSSLSTVSLPHSSEPLDDSNDSIRCSIQSDRFEDAQNQSPKPAKWSVSSSPTRTNRGSSTSNLRPLMHTRMSESSTHLKQSNVLGSKSSIQCETPSPMKHWPSVDMALVGEAGGSGILSSSEAANDHQCMSVTLNACADDSDHADKSNSPPQVCCQSQSTNQTSSTNLNKCQKEQLSQLREHPNDNDDDDDDNDDDDDQNDNSDDNDNTRETTVTTDDPAPVTCPSIVAIGRLQKENACIQDGLILSVEEEVGNAETGNKMVQVNPANESEIAGLSVTQRFTTGSKNFPSPSLCPVQPPQVSPTRPSVPQRNKSRYIQRLIRRLLLAFGLNILTQIPLVSLQLANVSCQTFRIVRPVLQSIALVSFAVCPYVYILANKVIHKLLISSQRTGDGCRK